MTLKELRSKCLTEIQDLNPVKYMPNINGDVRSAVRECTRYIGGMPRSTEISVVSGTQEYDVDNGFPSDFIADEGVHDDTNNKWLKRTIYKAKMYTGTGTPEEYYIRGRVLGFEREPDSSITMTLFYKGFGDNVTSDSATILSEFSLADDDPLWKAVIHEFAKMYWERRLSEAEHKGFKDSIAIAQSAIQRHDNKALLYRQKFAEQILGNNQNESTQVSLPADYFMQSNAFRKLDHGRIIRSR